MFSQLHRSVFPIPPLLDRRLFFLAMKQTPSLGRHGPASLPAMPRPPGSLRHTGTLSSIGSQCFGLIWLMGFPPVSEFIPLYPLVSLP